MEALTKQAIEQLTEQKITPPAVTIYTPTHRSAAPPNMTEDQIRFKNLIHRAEQTLKTMPAGVPLAKALCAKLDELLLDRSFWESQTEGLLLCASPDFIKLFQLPIDTAEHVTVGKYFHLAPVFSLLADEQSFYTLVLAQHNPHLYKADLYGLHESGITLPLSLEMALGIDENNQKSEQGRSTTRSTGSDGNITGFNGRGGARDPREEDRLHFFRMIDKQIFEHADRSLPLLIAGVESETTEYREISKYPRILDEKLAGNYADVPGNRLFDHAMQAFRKSVIAHEHSAVLDRYERVHGSNPQLAADDDMSAASAAESGRVDTLMVGMSRFTTDSVRNNMEPTTVLEFSNDKDDALINQTAQLVWSSGGRVVNIDSEKLPLNVRMHAILRY
jgi:Bacterial archaeo-eukaryotic release factor family 7